MNKNKLILPAGVIIGCLIIGAFFYLVQINKQESLERQQLAKLEEEKSLSVFNKKNKCMEICKEYYDNEVSSASELNFFNPLYTYNEKLDACFYSGGFFDTDLSEYRIVNCQTLETMATFTKYKKDVICASNKCVTTYQQFEEEEKKYFE